MRKTTYLWAILIWKLRPNWKIEFIGLENIDPKKTYLMLSNHQNMMDIPMITQLPLNFKWVSKREAYRIPFVGSIIWMRDDVVIERGVISSAKKMIKDCSNYFTKGLSIAIFPEGTRTKTGEIGNFHTGAFLLAKRVKQPILPMVICGNFDCFNDDKPKKQTFQLKILPAIEPETFAHLNMEELKNLLQDIITTEYKTLCQKYQKK